MVLAASRLSKSGVITSVRFSFAFFGVNERNCDFSPTGQWQDDYGAGNYEVPVGFTVRGGFDGGV